MTELPFSLCFSKCCWPSCLQLAVLMPAEQGFPHHALVTALLLQVRQDVLMRIGNMGVEKGNSVSLSYVSQVGRDKGTKEALKTGRMKRYGSFFSLLSSMSASVCCKCWEDVAENYQLCDLLSKGGHTQDIS